MKIRNGILNSGRAALLGGTFLVATLPTTLVFAQDANTSGNSAMAADVVMPTKAPSVNAADWYWNGIFEAGGNIFIEKPPSGFGKTSTNPFWLTPKTSDSNAKMDEYGKVPRGPFLDVLGINAGTKDGRFAVDFWADNVGYNNQRYRLELYEPGRQYFNIGWDQTPHLLSTSAKSIFGGVGSTQLTVDPVTRTFLQTQMNPNNQAQRNCIDNYINGQPTVGCVPVPVPPSAAINNIELQTLREKFTTGYRNTMLDDWDFRVDYSHEHRTGTRPLGIGWGFNAGAGVSPRPSSGSIEVPQPLDDRTQIANASGEYAGTTPWGTRWNTSLQYLGSFFSNDNKVLNVQNPFCITCNGTGAGALAPSGPNNLRYGLYPDNHVNGATWNTAVELPLFKTRYTSNIQYMAFRQNDPFINDISNGQVNLAPYPASSLNGEVNAFLTNNVLYSRLTNNLTNTVRVRYYDRKDNTPTLAFTNYVYADTGTNAAQPLTREPHSYSRLNVEDDLKWQANRMWTFGLGYFFERYTYANGEVDATNEGGAKAFINMTPWSWLTGRASVQYSQRRYDQWLGCATNDAGCAMRQFFVQNRDQTKAYMNVEVQLTKDLTVTPNGGLRWIEYPTDAVLNGAGGAGTPPRVTNSLGTQYDRGWNVGADISFRITPQFRGTFGYNYEEHLLYMQSCCGANIPFNDSNKWSSQIAQHYNTFVVSGLWNAIPGKLDILADYVLAISNEANSTIGCSSGNTGCTGNNSAGPPGPPWPDEKNYFQRFNILAKYYVDPSVVKQMGFVGNITLKARYTFEKNANTNWATDNFTPYSPSPADAGGADITNGGRSLFLAYNNPNYTAQIVALSVVAQW
jgi:MtrB/PioB family decaheme-associated outer membrane protein